MAYHLAKNLFFLAGIRGKEKVDSALDLPHHKVGAT